MNNKWLSLIEFKSYSLLMLVSLIGCNNTFTFHKSGYPINKADQLINSGKVTTVVAGGVLGSLGTGVGSLAIDTNKNIYSPSYTHINKISPTGVISVFAGEPNSMDPIIDGTASDARFSSPAGLTIDINNNLYVMDTGSVTTIRKITHDGIVTTIVPDGVFSGMGTGVGSLAVDTAGNIFTPIENAIYKVTPTGVVSVLAGDPSSFDPAIDGVGTNARFSAPAGITIDSQNNLYVIDSNNQGAIRKITKDGVVTTLVPAGVLGSSGSGSGSLAVDRLGNLYTPSSDNAIYKITPSGVISVHAGTPNVYDPPIDGTGTSARFSIPAGIAIDSNNRLYVIDSNDQGAIRKIE